MYESKQVIFKNGNVGYNIYNVPVVSEKHVYAFSEDGYKQRYDKKVIQSFFDEFLKNPDYKIPCFLGHFSNDNDEKETIAVLELVSIKEIENFGLTIFGNILYICENIYNRISAGKIPYWSSETVDNGETGEITGLAMLGNGKAPEFPYKPFLPDTLQELVYNEKVIVDFKKIKIKHRRKNMKDEITEEIENEKEEEETENEKEEEKTENEDETKTIIEKINAIYDFVKSAIEKKNEKEEENEEEKDEEKEQVKTASVSQNSKRIIELARKYPKATIKTLEKLERVGFDADELDSILAKENQKEKFATTVKETKMNTKKYTEDELIWLKNEKERYKILGIEGDPILTDSMKKTLKILGEFK